MHVVVPEQVVGDDGARRVYDGDNAVEWEPLVALKV